MRGIPAWVRPGRDRELADTRYAGQPSATDRAASRRAQRGSMGKPHPTAASAANAGEDFRTGTPTPKRRRGPTR